jgi:hypothetical protein
MKAHPKGNRARILLSSVFGPYAQDDEFGSRSINPMELYHNQVTRAQGSFSLRMFHRSWGIMMIQENISAPSAVLDFPTREAFAKELTKNHYDIVGISAIIVNLLKVREMCRMVRELSPHSEIVVGGHVAATPGLETMIDADHIVRGEGISWMRRYLGEDEHAPIRHPAIVSGLETRIMGVRLPQQKGGTAATIIPSVGCPMGCNFCTTSAFFGGKGKFINFYETGDELFDVMCRIESELKVNSFFCDGRELPASSRSGHAFAGAHEGDRQELGVVGLCLCQCAAKIHHAGTCGTRRFLGVDGIGVASIELWQVAGSRHHETDARVARTWHTSTGFNHHWTGTPHA